MAVRTGAEQDELAALGQAPWNCAEDQLHALMMIEPAHVGNDRLELLSQPQPIPKRAFVRVFVLDSTCRVVSRDLGINLGVPHIVINAVEDAAEFLLMNPESSLQAHPERSVANFKGITRRNGGDEIGIDDAALHQIYRRALVVEQSVVIHHRGRIEPRQSQNRFTVNALVADIVQSVADAGPRHAEMLINLIEQHRRERRMPIVAMDAVRVLIGLEHELQGGAAEKGEPLAVVRVPVEHAAIEEILRRMGFDEEALEALNEPEIDIAMDPLIEIGNPKAAEEIGRA